MLTALGPLVIYPLVTLLLEVFRAFGRTSARDSSNYELETIRENFDILLERWNVPYMILNAEGHERDGRYQLRG